MARTLVVYFSRTGRTHRIALEIAAPLGADIERIEEQRSRAGFLGYWRSGREAYRKLIPAIEPAVNDPSSYDIVLLGTPIWAGHISSPVRAYVGAHAGALSRMALFCTHGGSSPAKAFSEIAELAGVEPVATLAVTEREIKAGTYADRLTRFVESVAGPGPPATEHDGA